MPLYMLAPIGVGAFGLWMLFHSVRRGSNFGFGRPTFRCRLAICDSTSGYQGLDRGPTVLRWFPFKARAKWQGDVLIIHRAWLRWWTLRVPVHMPAGSF